MVDYKGNGTRIVIYVLFTLFLLIMGYLTFGPNVDFEIYPNFFADDMLNAAYVKGIVENGLWGTLFNTRIGAPDTSSLIDFPAYGCLFNIIIFIISLFIRNTATVIYVYLIITFMLDGLSMFLLLRKLDIDYLRGMIFSFLFAFAPFHFFRLTLHISLVSYMSVPATIYLCGVIVGAINAHKKWEVPLCIIIIGMEYGYWYAFSLILLAFSYFINYIRFRNIRLVLKKMYIMFSILILVLVCLLPRIIYSSYYGVNEECGKRVYVEQEVYGLKIINLILPRGNYPRINILKGLFDNYFSMAPLVNENSWSCLGIVGVIGFIILLCYAMVNIFNISYLMVSEEKHNILLKMLAIDNIVLLLFGTIGGFGEIFNAIITAQIRCYNRSSIFIEGFSLVALALVLNDINNRKIGVILSIFILLFGSYAQVKLGNFSEQEYNKKQQMQYESYFSQIEDALPEGAMVYQLPYMDFPEAGYVNSVGDYKHFLGYLFTDTIRWSYGGIKGRNNSARGLYIDAGQSDNFIQKLLDTGFSAVYIDTTGFQDGGREILDYYNSTGVTPIVSEDGTLWLFDISSYDAAAT